MTFGEVNGTSMLTAGIAVISQSISYAVVRSESELQEVWRLRTRRYTPRFPGSDTWWLDEDRDRAGLVFAARHADELVATVRIVPVTSAEPELAELGRFPAALLGKAGVWELGRLTAVPAKEPSGSYARSLFAWAARWSAQHMTIESLVSHCRGQKLNSFLAVGATVLDGPYALPGRGTNYYTIHAEIDTVLRRLAALGLAPGVAD